ncbi:MAG: hypothetical protein EAX96_16365 [Candidatus Lokiarchaeota archaeon]|nr:hypothetical protein [Candidatus Lokiarchaeota archaeon]
MVDLDLKIKYNKTYFYFAIFFALAGLMFLVAALMIYNDYNYALQIASISGISGNRYYQQMVFDLRLNFFLNIGFSIFAFCLSTFCGIVRFNSSQKTRRSANI